MVVGQSYIITQQCQWQLLQWQLTHSQGKKNCTSLVMFSFIIRFLHYITGRKIIRFNLRDKIIDTALVVNVLVLVPTLAEDVTSNCLYYIKSRNITSVNLPAGQTGGHCSYSYPIESSGKHYNVFLHINYV